MPATLRASIKLIRTNTISFPTDVTFMFRDLPARRGGSPGTADKTAAPKIELTKTALSTSKPAARVASVL